MHYRLLSTQQTGWFFAVACAAVSIGCSSGNGSAGATGGTTAGADSYADAGQTGDAAANDTGSTIADAGSTTADTGSTTADTGSTTADTGSTTADTGFTTADTGSTTADAGSISDTSADTSADGNAATDAGSGTTQQDGAASTDLGKAAPDATADAGTQPKSSPFVRVRLSSPLVEKAALGGKLSVACEHVDQDGKATADPGDWEILVQDAAGKPVAGAKQAKDPKTGAVSWSFAAAGRARVACKSAKLGLSSTAEVVIAAKALDPAISRLARHLSRSGRLVQQIIDLAGSTDAAKKKTQHKALQELAEAGKEMMAGFKETPRALIPHPKGMPGLAKLKAKGLKAGAQDGKWVAAVAALDQVLAAMKATIQGIDPNKPSAADLALLDKSSQAVTAAAKAVAALQPSTLAVYEHRAALDKLLGATLPATAAAHHALVLQMFRHQAKVAPPPPCPGCFSLVGVMVSIGIQYVLDSIPSYTSILKDMGWAIGEMALTMVIKDVIDDQFPPQAGGPSIVAIAQGLSAVAVLPGKEMTIMADHFGSQAGECGLVFVTPQVSKGIIDIVKAIVGGIPSLKDLKKKGAWEAAKMIKDAIDKLQAWIALGTDTVPTLATEGVVLMWSQTGSQFSDTMALIKLGVAPPKANCSFLPKPGILLPICKTTGRGPSFMVTVMKGSGC